MNLVIFSLNQKQLHVVKILEVIGEENNFW